MVFHCLLGCFVLPWMHDLYVRPEYPRRDIKLFSAGSRFTYVTLVPKKSGAIELGDYRPISCCNVLYKFIGKVLAN